MAEGGPVGSGVEVVDLKVVSRTVPVTAELGVGARKTHGGEGRYCVGGEAQGSDVAANGD